MDVYWTWGFQSADVDVLLPVAGFVDKKFPVSFILDVGGIDLPNMEWLLLSAAWRLN